MISSIQSALSGLQAFGTKIHSNANNIANSNTEGYKRTRVTLAEQNPNGVKAEVRRSEQPGPMIYTETNNGLELVEQSNVDIANELPDMMLNTNFYKANLKTLQAADEILGSVLDLKA